MASRGAKMTFLTNYEPHILDVRERFKGQFSLYTHNFSKGYHHSFWCGKTGPKQWLRDVMQRQLWKVSLDVKQKNNLP